MIKTDTKPNVFKGGPKPGLSFDDLVSGSEQINYTDYRNGEINRTGYYKKTDEINLSFQVEWEWTETEKPKQKI